VVNRSGARRLAVVSMLAIGGAGLSVATSGCSESTDAGAASRLSLKGTWSGHRERISATEGYRTGIATLKVTQQRGRTFKGTLTRSNPDGNVTEPLVGGFTSDGTLIAGSDEEGTYHFRLIDDSTLDYCYTESGKGFRTTCARLEKK
jgi:hypothetical protein